MKGTSPAMKLQDGDDLIVALRDLGAGQRIEVGGQTYVLAQPVAAKHKFAARDLVAGQPIRMYGVTVGIATREVAAGEAVATENLAHAVDEPVVDHYGRTWDPPRVDRWADCRFLGYVRPDGRVGTANHWLVIPLVFCESRNVWALRDALAAELGYAAEGRYRRMVRERIRAWQAGRPIDQMGSAGLAAVAGPSPGGRVFEHVDGIQFLAHGGGCGETDRDTDALCRLLASYITHPNVAGATVLSLGCQKAQADRLQREIRRLDPRFAKPMEILDQQSLGTESALVERAIRATVAGLIQANRARREPVPLSRLIVGTECGGSDGFSGLSANPAIGHCVDLVVALGGSAILGEFPELCSVQRDLVQRCRSRQAAERFLQLMATYQERLAEAGSGFEANPSPGNIADGLITDGMKAAGAARKGGTSPVVDVLDYPETIRHPGLTLLCTPGGDVESTTALAGCGATIILFSTGLGTPTGNPITPVLKVSSNTPLAERMPDIIDLDAGPVVRGQATVAQIGEQLLERVIETASGRYRPKAVRLGQDDFLPWKRFISL